MTVDERTLLARAYLSRVVEAGSRALWSFVDEVGPVEAAAAIRRGAAPEKVLSAAAARRDHVDPGADLDAAQAVGARLVTPESDEWPHFALGALSRTALRTPQPSDSPRAHSLVPPVGLWVRGEGSLAALGIRSAGIVGSRSATPYGEHVTTELAYGLATRGVAVISGGAYGIDAAAHRGALAADGRTVIVSAGGIDRPYPQSNASLFDRAAQDGWVISEYPPGCAPHRSRFLVRNRLIAALSSGVVVVEAALRSGARNTAACAMDLGRPLMVVPGPVTSAMSAGCHEILRNEGSAAVLVGSVEDVLAVVGAVGEGVPIATQSGHPAGDVRDLLEELDAVSRRVFDGMQTRRFLSAPEIARHSGIDVLDVIRTLPGLELAGLLESSEGGFRVSRAAAPPAPTEPA